MDSDGSVYKHCRGYLCSEFTSINLELLEDIQDILFSLGVISSLTKLRDAGVMNIQGRSVSTSACYYIRIGNYYTKVLYDKINGNNISKKYEDHKLGKIKSEYRELKTKKRGCLFSDDKKYIYVQIKNIDKRKYTGYVYNIHNKVHNYLLRCCTSRNCDPFKNEKADTESLGAFYILKRLVHINDPFAYKIVASYVSRPPKSDDFCRTCEDLIEAYGAKCLMENADRIFELYLARRHKEMILLEDGEQLANRIIKQGVRQNNKLGLSPTVQNQRMLFSAVLQYCWEEIIVGYDEDGNEIKQKGIYRIDDIELLDEIIAFGPGVNTDRIIAFGHALLLARYYDDMNFMPESPVKKYNEAVRKKRKIEQYKGIVLRRHNPFKMR